MEILFSEAIEDEDLFYNSNSDNKKLSATYEETEYLKQKEEEWLERKYKNMKMDIHVLSNKAVEDEDLFFYPDDEDYIREPHLGVFLDDRGSTQIFLGFNPENLGVQLNFSN